MTQLSRRHVLHVVPHISLAYRKMGFRKAANSRGWFNSLTEHCCDHGHGGDARCLGAQDPWTQTHRLPAF
jgi:hypothetical protein